MKRTFITLLLFMCLCPSWGNTTYKATHECKKLIMRHEGFSPKAYWDSNGYSIGYGHHTNVRKGQTITKATALDYLHKDIKVAETHVNWLIDKLPYKCRFSNGFINGFTSFVYNVGVGNAQNSTFYKRLKACRVRNGKMNQSDFQFALAALKTSCISSEGHKKRRADEYDMARRG